MVDGVTEVEVESWWVGAQNLAVVADSGQMSSLRLNMASVHDQDPVTDDAHYSRRDSVDMHSKQEVLLRCP